jgi:hypothetical protein
MQQPIQPTSPSRKPLIFGILNLLFAALYLYLAINVIRQGEALLSQVPSSYRGSLRIANYMDLAADLIGAVGLLIAGVLLLQKQATGRTLTRTIAAILGVAIVIMILYTLFAFSGAAGSLLMPLVLGLLLRFGYVFIARWQLAPDPIELGLT